MATPQDLTAYSDALLAYQQLLATAGVDRGLIGPREVDRLWERHILNCAVVAPLVPRGTSVIDIGSGAGLPGLVWAIIRADVRVILLEPLLRRSVFLTEAVAHLGLSDRVEVVRGRAEDSSIQTQAPITTARAVAPLSRLVRWALPLTQPGGELLALKGASAEAEIHEAAGELKRWGGRDVEIVEFGHGIVDPPTRVVRVRKSPDWR